MSTFDIEVQSHPSKILVSTHPPAVSPGVPKTINWWIIGGIITVVILISVVVWQVVALRRA